MTSGSMIFVQPLQRYWLFPPQHAGGGRWMDEWMVGWMDGWMDEWMDGWMDGWMN